MLANKPRTKRPRNTKVDRNIAHPTDNNVYDVQGQRLKIKVTRSTNVETGSASYRPNGRAYELQMWYTDGVQRSVSPTSAVISKVIGQGRKVT